MADEAVGPEGCVGGFERFAGVVRLGVEHAALGLRGGGVSGNNMDREGKGVVADQDREHGKEGRA